jgi:hypothetical protein
MYSFTIHDDVKFYQRNADNFCSDQKMLEKWLESVIIDLTN